MRKWSRKPLREVFEITKIAKRFDRTSNTFNITISYKTATDITPRTLAVAEAFGIGVDQNRQQVLYDNIELRIAPNDIIYITGESGSGKSVLLKRLEKLLSPNTINIKDVQVNHNKPLIDTVGNSLQEGLELLSRVGLNDAFLFIRRYSQLSDGQKYRYRIAKLIETNKQYWVMDEFCSTLDRETAKIVAFNIQKLARQEGKAVLAATTHTDLFNDLKPSVHVHKRFGREVEVKYYPNKVNRVCSVTRNIRIEEGTIQDYKKLAQFHYRESGGLPPPRKVFTLKRNKETVGVIVYSYSPITCFGRSKVFPKRLAIEELNRDFSIISRVVLHPKYRTVGLGARLVKETLPEAGTKHVEAIAVMARYNRFFERANMQKITESTPSKYVLNAIEKLRTLGFNPITLSSEETNMRTLKKMSNRQVEQVRIILKTLCKRGYGRRLLKTRSAFPTQKETANAINDAALDKIAKTLRVLSFLVQIKVYLFWKKPVHCEINRCAEHRFI